METHRMCHRIHRSTPASQRVRRAGQSRLPRANRRRAGAVSVEFAVVAPILFLLIFICFEFTRLCMMTNLAQDAAYVAARHAMVEGSTTEDATHRANAVLAQLGTKNATVTVNGGKGLNEDSSVVAVRVDIPMSDNSFVIPKFIGGKTISAEISLIAERYNGFYDADVVP